MNIYTLPFDITVTTVPTDSRGVLTGEVTSSLIKHMIDKPTSYDKGFRDAIESFLLSMACEGVTLSDVRISKALETTIEAYGNNAD